MPPRRLGEKPLHQPERYGVCRENRTPSYRPYPLLGLVFVAGQGRCEVTVTAGPAAADFQKDGPVLAVRRGLIACTSAGFVWGDMVRTGWSPAQVIRPGLRRSRAREGRGFHVGS
jgi:hypothetical protein